MTHEITKTEHHIAGDSIRWDFTVNQNGSARDITTDELEWYLFNDEFENDAGNAILSDGDATVTLTKTTPDQGEFEVVVDEGATSDLGGDYWIRTVVDPSDDSKQTWKGQMVIDP